MIYLSTSQSFGLSEKLILTHILYLVLNLIILIFPLSSVTTLYLSPPNSITAFKSIPPVNSKILYQILIINMTCLLQHRTTKPTIVEYYCKIKKVFSVRYALLIPTSRKIQYCIDFVSARSPSYHRTPLIFNKIRYKEKRD